MLVFLIGEVGILSRRTAMAVGLVAAAFCSRCSCSNEDIYGDGNSDGDSNSDDFAQEDIEVDVTESSLDSIGNDEDLTDLSGFDTVDTWPDPTFEPAYDGFGEIGWEESDEPLCRGYIDGEIRAQAVWSDDRGVFLLVDYGSMPDLDAGVLRELLVNDGTGWIAVIDEFIDWIEYPEIILDDIQGIPDGMLFGWGRGSLFEIDTLSWGMTRNAFGISDLHVVNSGLAYGILNSDPRLVWYDGISWGPYPGDPLMFDVFEIWASEDSIFIAGENGIVLSTFGDGWTVHDTRTMNDFRSIWGFSGNDVWAGTQQGTLHHFDGFEWNQISWPALADGSDNCQHTEEQGIFGMWGQDGILFIHSINEIAMWDGVDFTVLGYWPGTETSLPGGGYYCKDAININSIWGKSVDEVFLVVLESGGAVVPHLCPEYLLWWDGSSFHWF